MEKAGQVKLFKAKSLVHANKQKIAELCRAKTQGLPAAGVLLTFALVSSELLDALILCSLIGFNLFLIGFP